MNITRRAALQLAALPLIAQEPGAVPFQPTWESLQQYRCPEWFRDAKLGFWAHWGPQGGPMQGDWYARNIYIQGTRQNKYHVEHFGHPSKVGYKDVIPLWTAKNWEPETLIRRYKKAGARYFMSLGVHCDNFDCWDSQHHSWNAVNHGPKRDVVGAWRKVARRNGLRFGVSEHLAWSYTWFNVNKNSDKTGPLAGVPYDGNDPEYRGLYFPPHEGDQASYAQSPSDWWKQEWLRRVKDLIDQQQPDLVYTDGGAFDGVGLEAIAHYYNQNLRWHKGSLEGVYTLKNHTAASKLFGDFQAGASTRDVERGLLNEIQADPFQTDTCIGQWFYYEGFEYKPVKTVVHMFIDIVSKNGNMVLSIPQLPDGTIDTKEESILDDFTAWTAVHGEAIFGTRPWKIFGEGPTSNSDSGIFSERTMKPFTAADIRFTTRGDKLYAFCLGWPERDIAIRAAAQRKIDHIRLLGSGERISWTVEDGSLRILRPQHKVSELAIAFEIS